MLMKLSLVAGTAEGAAPARKSAARPGGTWRRGLALVAGWIARGRQRRQLAALDDRLLADVGITRAQARHEVAKPFWR